MTNNVVDIPFFKKLTLPSFSLGFLGGKPARVVGIDIGTHSTKVVQLKYAEERAILETYGELLSGGYLRGGETGGGILRYLDDELTALVKDVLQESNVTSKDAIMSVPAHSSFVTKVSFPRVPKEEISKAIPYEARKYIPIPMSEVVLDWDILEPRSDDREKTEVILVAVPREVIQKYRRIAETTGLRLRALEVETFSAIRSLVFRDPAPTLVIDLGHRSTALAIVDRGKLQSSHSITHGSQELTRAIAQGLHVNEERAEIAKRDVGLSERVEEKDITSILTPPIDALFAEVERGLSIYNRKAERKVQKIALTGGGSHLKGLVEYAASYFGIEVTRGDPFARVVAPAFMQSTLRDIGPNFSVAVGLALREITT